MFIGGKNHQNISFYQSKVLTTEMKIKFISSLPPSHFTFTNQKIFSDTNIYTTNIKINESGAALFS